MQVERTLIPSCCATQLLLPNQPGWSVRNRKTQSKKKARANLLQVIWKTLDNFIFPLFVVPVLIFIDGVLSFPFSNCGVLLLGDVIFFVSHILELHGRNLCYFGMVH